MAAHFPLCDPNKIIKTLTDITTLMARATGAEVRLRVHGEEEELGRICLEMDDNGEPVIYLEEAKRT